MKLRIKGNSIRVRLSKSEVDEFANKGTLTEDIDFGENQLTYVVKSYVSRTMSATFIAGEITLYIPRQLLQQWSSSNDVSLQHNVPLKDDNHLHILIEKDFKCIDADASEDQSDYFDNPSRSC